MNCFCGMVDRRKTFSLISSRDHCQRSSPSRIFDTPRAGFEPAHDLNSVVITTTPRRHNYCSLIWHFCSSKSLYKIKRIQERALRLVHNDFASDYVELLKKSGKATTEIKRLRSLALEIFKTMNNLNPYYMKEILSKTTNLTHRLGHKL